MSSNARLSGGGRRVIRNETEHTSEQNLRCFVPSALPHSMQVFGMGFASLAMLAWGRAAPPGLTDPEQSALRGPHPFFRKYNRCADRPPRPEGAFHRYTSISAGPRQKWQGQQQDTATVQRAEARKDQ
jgi:hypothetical protein